MIKKFCLKCGNEFGVPLNRKDSAKFCSRECKHNIGRTNKKCLFCGKPFLSPNHLNRVFCSRKCSDESKKRRAVKICRICGKKYEVQKYYASTSKYCSFKCRNIGIPKALKGRFKGRKSPCYKGKIIKVCKYCGKKFKIHLYRKNIAHHCSISCSKLDTSSETRKKIAQSIKKLQEDNPKIHPNYILSQKGHVTKIESLLKDELSKRSIGFKMQYRIQNYWIDFAFPDIKLAVECDGKRWHSTEEQVLKDKKRDESLSSLGWYVKRFKEGTIMNNPKRVADKIEKLINLRKIGSTGN